MTALKFLQSSQQPSRFFVSGDSVGVVRLWQEAEDGEVSFPEPDCARARADARPAKWSTFAVLSGHIQSVSALAIIELPQGQGQQTDLFVLSGGSEGVVQAWKVSSAGAGQSLRFCTPGKASLTCLAFQSSSRSLISTARSPSKWL